MPRCRSLWLFLVLIFSVAGLSFLLQSAAAQGAEFGGGAKSSEVAASRAPATVNSPSLPLSATDLETLAKSLDSPTERGKLIQQLQALAAAARAEHPAALATPSGFFHQLWENIAGGANKIGTDVAEALGSLQDIPRLKAWAYHITHDPVTTQRLTTLGWKLAVTIIVALAAEFLVTLALRRPRRRIETHPGGGIVPLAILLLGRTILDIAPIGVFTMVGYLLLPILQPGHYTEIIAHGIINAIVMVRIVLLLTQILVSPGAVAIRLLPLSDESANYIYIWVRRLASVLIYGYVAIEAALLLGLPQGTYSLFLRLLGLILTVLLAVVILQNRRAVGDWLRHDRTHSREIDGFHRGLLSARHRLAEIWHILGMIYLVAVFGVWALNIPHGFEFLLRATLLSVALFVLQRFLLLGIDRLIDRSFRIKDDVKARLPNLELRANRYLPLLHSLVHAVVYLFSLFILLEVWGARSFTWLTSNDGRHIAGSVLSIMIIVIIAVMMWEITAAMIERYLSRTDGSGTLLARSARTRTLLPLLRNALMVVLTIFVGLMTLSQLGVNIAPLLAGAGVIGVAIGFGSQTLIKDLITGLFILVEDTVSVGDWVEVDGRSGSVESLSIRSIRLRDGDGAVHTVPFSAVSAVKNSSKNFSLYNLNVSISYDTDPAQAILIIRDIINEMQGEPAFKNLMLGPLDLWGIDKIGRGGIVISGNMRVTPLGQYAIGREINKRLKQKFDAAGIGFPVPAQDINLILPKSISVPIAAGDSNESAAIFHNNIKSPPQSRPAISPEKNEAQPVDPRRRKPSDKLLPKKLA